MAEAPSERLSGFARVAGGSWLILGAAITAPAFLWHVQYFQNPGQQFYRLFLMLLPVLFAGAVAYARLRRRWLGWEAWMIVAPAALIGAVSSPVAAAIALAFGASALAIGSRIKMSTGGTAERLVLAFGFGFSFWILALLALSAAHALYAGSVAALLVASLFIGWRGLADELRLAARWGRAWAKDESAGSTLAGICVPFLIGFVLLSALAAFAPPRGWDVLHHHLPPAQYYAEIHRLLPFPNLDYTYFPQGSELLMAAAWSLGGRGAAQIMPALFFGLLLLLTAAITERCGGSRAAGLLGVTLVAATPFLHWSGSTAKNDVILTFFVVAGLLCFLIWTGERRFRALAAGAFFLGVAMHVKYVAVFGAAALIPFYLYAVMKERRKVVAAAALAAIGIAVACPYLVRAYAAKGDPFYPQSASVARESGAQAHRHGGIPIVSRFVDVTTAVLFHGRAAFENVGPSENPAGVFPVLFVPLAALLLGLARKPAERVCWLFAVLYFVAWALQLSILRYAMPLVVVLAAMVGIALVRFAAASWVGRSLAAGALIYSYVFSLCAILIVTVNAPLLAYYAHRIDAPQYLAQLVPEYPALRYLGRKSKPGEPILGFEACAITYAPRPAEYACHMCYEGPCSTATIRTVAGERENRWIILPNRAEFQEFARELTAGGNGAKAYEDGAYTVYRVGGNR